MMKYDYLRKIGGGFYVANDKQKQVSNVVDERDVVFYRDIKSADMMSKHYMLVSKHSRTVLVDVRDWSEVLDDIKSWRTLNSWSRPYIATRCDSLIETVSFNAWEERPRACALELLKLADTRFYHMTIAAFDTLFKAYNDAYNLEQEQWRNKCL